MPPIPEDMPSDSMDEFVNWDAAELSVGEAAETGRCGDDGHDAGFVTTGQEAETDPLQASVPVHNREALLFENPDADIFSLMALQHYEQSNTADAWDTFNPQTGESLEAFDFDASVGLVPGGAVSAEMAPDLSSHDLCPPELWDVPGQPCTSCKLGGYQCKTISEGFYKGYCTSCVALRRACSFGLASPGPLPTNESFPPNPWPTIGDHPDPILALAEHGDLAPYSAAPRETMQPGASGLASLLSGRPDAAHQNGPPLADSTPAAAPPQPKLGTRFSRESARILKNWIVTHSRHPYPTEEENESLQRLTGLNKTQISNWLANARRRGKIPTTRSTSPHVRSSYTSVGPIETSQPRRSGTPSPFDRRLQEMDNLLLQRWAYSPPENEPANASDIARAITSSGVASGLESPSSFNFTDDGSGRSLFNDSTNSSLGTSHSSGAGSFASAFSHGSRGSFGSTFSSLGRGRRRRRRRHSTPRTSGDLSRTSSEQIKASTLSKRMIGPSQLNSPLRTFQCTFCTETFKTKHDWQRHEKSLHLSLERWVCSPQGPVSTHPETRLPSCVFCGEANPDEAHIESHNFAACQERSMSDRTFYRKDHLRQHLRLVHGVKFVGWAMDPWKVATPNIRSRCGFCGMVLDTWSVRIDHLADHFKSGQTMADWKGDWGFDEPVFKLVENSIPPYLIHHERNTPLPFSAARKPSCSPRNVYELLRDELQYWLQNRQQGPGPDPGDPEQEQAMRLEACRIVFAADGSCEGTPGENCPSWLRDLVLADSVCTQRARLSPLRMQKESLLDSLTINGKRTPFEACPLEAALHDFARDRALMGSPVTDTELQAEACRIFRKMESDVLDARNDHTIAGSTVADFFVRMALHSTAWLADFHTRAQLPRLEATGDSSGSSFPARISDSESSTDIPRASDASDYPITASKLLFVSDTNCYRRLAQELARFVSATMSPNNANAHIPTDEEIQQQARRVLYDDDDPWNQTAADNAEWLMRFKRDVGILPEEDGPGLPANTLAWNVTQGGSGFAPPYCFPQASSTAPLACPHAMDSGGGSGHSTSGGGSDRGSGPPGSTVSCPNTMANSAPGATDKFLQSITTRYAKPARVFCSRELEAGLADFVRAVVVERGEPFPTDAALRAKGREILGCSPLRGTSVDSDDLLGKFKDMVRADLAQEQQQQQQQQHDEVARKQQPLPPAGFGAGMASDLDGLGLDMSLDALTQEDMDNLMQDMGFEF